MCEFTFSFFFQRKDIPQKKWLKPALQEWLEKNATSKGIDYDPKKKYLKDKLWDLIKPAVGKSYDFLNLDTVFQF